MDDKQPLKTIGGGTIVYRDTLPGTGFGRHAIVTHAGGWTSLYAHMCSWLTFLDPDEPNNPPEPGETTLPAVIHQGDWIGGAGNTGFVSPAPTEGTCVGSEDLPGAHLHMIVKNGSGVGQNATLSGYTIEHLGQTGQNPPENNPDEPHFSNNSGPGYSDAINYSVDMRAKYQALSGSSGSTFSTIEGPCNNASRWLHACTTATWGSLVTQNFINASNVPGSLTNGTGTNDYWLVSGAIWKVNGSAAGQPVKDILGHPVADEQDCAAGVRCQFFEGGIVEKLTDRNYQYLYQCAGGSCSFVTNFCYSDVIGQDICGAVSSPDLYIITNSPAYRRLDGAGAWQAKADGSQAGPGPNRLKYFGAGLMFHMTADSGNDGQGSLRRSADYGDTWTTLAAPSGADKVIDIARAPNGRLWSLWAENPGFTLYRLKVYYSDDNGTTWTLSLTHTAEYLGYFIAVHPTDSNKIAFTVNHNISGSRLGTRVTTNGGASWGSSQEVTPGGNKQAATNQGGLVWTSGGRLIVYQTRLNSTQISTSDDNGTSWTLRVQKTETRFWGQLIRGSNGVIFAVKNIDGSPTGDHAAVFRSTDGGTTWQEIQAPGAGLPAQVEFGNSLAYDSVLDELYLGAQDENNVYRLKNASVVAPARAHLTWELLANPDGSVVRYHNLVLIKD